MKPFRNTILPILSVIAFPLNGQFSTHNAPDCDSSLTPDANFEIKHTIKDITQLPYVFKAPSQVPDSLIYTYKWFLSKTGSTEFLNDTSVTDIDSLVHAFDSVGGTYSIRLIIENSADCSADTLKTFQVEEILDIPNFFSPDENGRNDLWVVRSTMNYDYTTYLLEIYTRTGTLIYQIDETKIITWDGRNQSGQEMAEGPYFYSIINKKTGFKKAGFVYLFRVH